MPVILSDKTWEMWLDPEISFSKVYAALYESNPKDLLSYHKVASVVNAIKNDNEDCCLELKEYEKKLHARGLGRFFGQKKAET